MVSVHLHQIPTRSGSGHTHTLSTSSSSTLQSSSSFNRVSIPRQTPRIAPRSVSSLRSAPSATSRTSSATGSKSAVVILPGFLYGASQYNEMAKNFRNRGRAADIAPVRSWQWVSTIAGGSFDFYLEAAHATVERMYNEHGPLALVGHSAGGWLARLLLGDQPYNGRVWGDAHMVHSLLCLGTPHLCLENYPYGRVPEQLKLTPQQASEAPPHVAASSLCFANHFYPTAQSIPGVHTVCVVGRAVQGQNTNAFPLLPEPFATEKSQLQFAYDSYVANCGQGDVWGDGVCPVDTGKLPGADVIELHDVWHMAGPPGRMWYGSKKIVSLLDSCIEDHPSSRLAASTANCNNN